MEPEGAGRCGAVRRPRFDAPSSSPADVVASTMMVTVADVWCPCPGQWGVDRVLFLVVSLAVPVVLIVAGGLWSARRQAGGDESGRRGPIRLGLKAHHQRDDTTTEATTTLPTATAT